ncbi:alginate lyase family protein [Pseudochryseolinea flava]|uniref:Alginate lyase n=1 Tax=Pseudochryseolinea flava TaxID=2059302 RepID=A0A364Y3G1_9BACT|nr:alginate lyase family protein [Pseudochryseolinea flava]RAW00884.1 alginate lyase [Pseudochryseolinea flava]
MNRIVLCLTVVLIMSCANQLELLAQQVSFEEVSSVLRKDVLQHAAIAMNEAPITVTAERSPRSAGNAHCFFSEGDYWWPDPANPNGPYIQRDGLSNPNNFIAHRHAMIRFSQIVGTLVSAYLITNDQKYLVPVRNHVRAWFVDSVTYMEPHLNFAQAIKGRVTGRGIGIIDTIHLMEVAQSLLILFERDLIDAPSKEKILAWFRAYLHWLKTSTNGIEEMNAKNNHGTCWVMQVASFAKLVNDTTTLNFCRSRYKNVLIPEQMSADGSFPLELKRTKPYGYSIFNLDAMTMVCQVLSTPADNLWAYHMSDGRSINKAIDFLYPFLENKIMWPYAKDVMYWEEWPVAQPLLIFGANQFGNKKWFSLWKQLDHAPTEHEVIRNLPIRHPLLWIDQK